MGKKKMSVVEKAFGVIGLLLFFIFLAFVLYFLARTVFFLVWNIGHRDRFCLISGRINCTKCLFHKGRTKFDDRKIRCIQQLQLFWERLFVRFVLLFNSLKMRLKHEDVKVNYNVYKELIDRANNMVLVLRKIGYKDKDLEGKVSELVVHNKDKSVDELVREYIRRLA